MSYKQLGTMEDLLESLEYQKRPLIVVDVDDLRELINEMVDRRMQPKEEEYLSSVQVKNMFGVSQSTLWRWANEGYLPKSKFGRTNFYKKSDIDKCLKAH